MVNGEFTKIEIAIITNALRQASIIWPIRAQVFKNAQVKVKEGKFKNGKPRYKYYWRCASCEELFRDKSELEVDHIEEVGSFTGDVTEFCRRLFCDIGNLQLLCIKCHHAKTTRNARLLWKRKRV